MHSAVKISFSLCAEKFFNNVYRADDRTEYQIKNVYSAEKRRERGGFYHQRKILYCRNGYYAQDENNKIDDKNSLQKTQNSAEDSVSNADNFYFFQILEQIA